MLIAKGKLYIDGKLMGNASEVSFKKKEENDFVSGFKLISKAATQASLSFKIIGDNFFLLFKNIYLKDHSRLPGSDKTKRLRKKRRTTIFRYAQQKWGGNLL